MQPAHTDPEHSIVFETKQEVETNVFALDLNMPKY